MIHIQGKIPRSVIVAASGGSDSMAIVDFLKKTHSVTILYFNHGTEHGKEAKKFLSNYASIYKIPFITNDYEIGEKQKNESQEDFWRKHRYNFFLKHSDIITGHNLNDCVETWIWSSMHGISKLIPYNHANVFRPFLLTRKETLKEWCVNKNVPWLEDPSNIETEHMRNYIRHTMMPHVLHVNPGIFKTIRKKLIDRMTE
jgi:tRNA(Ile)-lysidine synthetase-like protein